MVCSFILLLLLPSPLFLSVLPPPLPLQLSWILDLEGRRRHRYLLLSLGNEGKVLIWECQPRQRELKLLKGFRLLTENVPRSLRVGRAKSGGQVGGKWRGSITVLSTPNVHFNFSITSSLTFIHVLNNEH